MLTPNPFAVGDVVEFDASTRVVVRATVIDTDASRLIGVVIEPSKKIFYRSVHGVRLVKRATPNIEEPKEEGA